MFFTKMLSYHRETLQELLCGHQRHHLKRKSIEVAALYGGKVSARVEWMPYLLFFSLVPEPEDIFSLFYFLFLKSVLNLLQYCFCCVFWSFGPQACGILAPQAETKPTSLALEGGVFTTGPQRSPVKMSLQRGLKFAPMLRDWPKN